MALPGKSTHAKTKSAVALLLTFTAGIVDIVGYITVYHLFVAHMTGTTVHLGNKLEGGSWADAARAGIILASFVAGSVLGRAVLEAGFRSHKRTVASSTLAAEAVLVLAFVWFGAVVLRHFTPETIPLGTACLLAALLAGAMGLQTATLTRIGPLTIHTTFVTGMLNKMAQEAARWLFWMHDTWRQSANVAHFVRSSGQHASFRNAQFMMAIWFSYMIGSVTGTWMDARWKTAALYVPVLILLVSIAVDQVQPLSIEEENDQS
ncbi:MAG TPA: YoaK family protein [Candidatus Sulfotelmatobacter sp.]|nr:YoaK family protein [Candidatus Sulfotelmatobacter sp.]